MCKRCLFLTALLLAGCPAFAQQDQKPAAAAPAAEYKIPDEAVKMVNPVKPTAESLARAKRTMALTA